MTLRAAVLPLLLCLAACAAARAGAGPETATAVPAAAETPALAVPASREQIRLSFAPVVRQAAPAVVNIYTRKIVERRLSPFANDPFFREFFGDMFRAMPGQRRIENSLGSGVILDPSGIVVSNHHVVAGADEITVVLADRREFEGRVIFADEQSDLAVVALEGASGLPALALRDSDTLEVGDLVLAIGNPFGVGQTVTSGIVSGLARSGAGRRLRDGYFIQTDAAINPGNSGGALVDMDGRLVGVNTAILSRSGGSIGIGFAVPSNLVARVVEAARAGERALARPWLGMRAQPVTGDLAEALGLDQPRGLLIDELHPRSPFARAGLEAGDVLAALDGAPVETVPELEFRAATLGTGRTVGVSWLRRGAQRQARVALEPAPEVPPREPVELSRGLLRGLGLVSVNPAVIEEYRLPLSARGVLVTRARDRAARAGFRQGDILLAVNGQRLERVGDFSDTVSAARGRIDIEVLRDGQRGTLRLGG